MGKNAMKCLCKPGRKSCRIQKRNSCSSCLTSEIVEPPCTTMPPMCLPPKCCDEDDDDESRMKAWKRRETARVMVVMQLSLPVSGIRTPHTVGEHSAQHSKSTGTRGAATTLMRPTRLPESKREKPRLMEKTKDNSLYFHSTHDKHSPHFHSQHTWWSNFPQIVKKAKIQDAQQLLVSHLFHLYYKGLKRALVSRQLPVGFYIKSDDEPLLAV